MTLKALIFAALVASVLSRPEGFPAYEHAAPTAPAKYDFEYSVQDQPSGNDFGHQEVRDGANTQGSYYVVLPDGRLQRVNYNVDGDSGYVAEVNYEGEVTQAPYTTPPRYA